MCDGLADRRARDAGRSASERAPRLAVSAAADDDAVVGIQRRLQAAGDTAWFDSLRKVEEADASIDLDEQSLAELLPRLQVPEVDRSAMVAAAREVIGDPELAWVLRRECGRVSRQMGTWTDCEGGPDLPAELGVVGRYFYALAFCVSVPAVQAFHHARGVPAEISWATLTDLGEKLSVNRKLYRVGVLRDQSWFTLHRRGILYRLGRLQFALAAHDDEPVLDTHIPELRGSLSDGECVEAFRRAQDFFPRYFPEHGFRTIVCTSWLLDPQLAEHLPTSSNILAFQHHFDLDPIADEPDSYGRTGGDRAVLRFVFARIDARTEDLPQDTRLQRALVAHWRSGRHLHNRSGTLRMTR